MFPLKKVGTSLVFVFLLLMPTMVLASPIKVVATFSILGDLVKSVGKDKVDLVVLVGANSDAHTFEPTPQDNIVLSNAQLIFENGLHFEHWMDDIYSSSNSKAKRIVVTEDIETINIDDKAKDVDPHVWHDVSNVMVMVERVRGALIEADSANSAYYNDNAEAYLAKLGELDHWIIDTLKDLPDESRRLVTSHDTLGYFAKRYGFSIAGTVIASATTEAQDPSAQQIVQLLNMAKELQVKAFFAENTHNVKLVENLAKEAGVLMAPFLYTDALGTLEEGVDTYIKMMQYNITVIEKALR